jgi:hypothetical protein
VGGSNDTSLQTYYKKYKACIEAQHTLDLMSAEGTWPGKKPNHTDIIKCFFSASMWHSHVKRMSKVSQYPLMQQWLEGGDDAPEDLKVWGFEKPVASYNFVDLFIWLDRQEEGKDKGKGKKKEKTQEVDTDTDGNEGSSKEKRKKKKKVTVEKTAPKKDKKAGRK